MPTYMDIHRNMTGITPEQLRAAHQADLDIESAESVHFQHAWADPTSGSVFCLSDGPSREAVQRVHERAGHPADEIYEVPIEV
ncbi:SCO4226 family nickel-binding protein [Kitasatospora sp. MAP5-34]|uniref:SCO4226 family nickel-binding protein n=1 Tax=Kitasatospora sp. MAP5-34 TaxID=3035102 RepID=UPI00247390FE|nr:SCO4226 family nickel-binding protein [Kitasatospora sp. MAP5-34]